MTVSETNFHLQPEQHLEFETLLADLSARFVGLPSEALDQEIENAQRRICGTLGLDRSTLTQFAGPNGEARITHSWAILGHKPSPIMPIEQLFPWALQRIRSGQAIQFTSLDELPTEAAIDIKSFRLIKQKSNITFPLMVGGEVLGALSFGVLKSERHWPDALVKRLQLVAQIFANALARKRDEQALRDSAERYRSIITTTADGFWEVDDHGRIIAANDEGSRLYGYGRDEFLTKSLQDLEANENPDEIRAHIEKIKAVGHVRFETRHRCKDGRIIDVEVSTTYRPSSRTFLAFLRNITERKHAEEALHESEARLKAGADLAGVGYYEVDFGELSSFADQRFGEICGVPAGQQQSLERVEFWIEHIHPDDLQRVLEERRKAHEGKIERYDIEYRYLHPAQGQRWIHHLGCVATRNAPGRVIRAYGVIRDITADKRAEIEAQDLRDNLAHLGRVNTLGALAGSLAHELNQPLGIVLSNAQAAQDLLAQEPPDVAEVQAILADIVAANRRVSDVIVRLRALLKRGMVSVQRLPLNEVIEEVLRIVQADFIERGVTVVLELAPSLPSIMGDRVQLQQLLLNLILNAAEAMSANAPGARRIHLQTVFDRDNVRTSVRDEGGGLTADGERLFQPFYTTKPQGLGMGLAVCRTIIDAHHGRLWAEPHPERGAVFYFELPVAGQVAS